MVKEDDEVIVVDDVNTLKNIVKNKMKLGDISGV